MKMKIKAKTADSHGPKIRTDLIMKGEHGVRTFWLPNKEYDYDTDSYTDLFLGWEKGYGDNKAEIEKYIGDKGYQFGYWYVMGLKYFEPMEEGQEKRKVSFIEELDLGWREDYRNLALSAAKMIGDADYDPGFEPCFLQRVPNGVMIF